MKEWKAKWKLLLRGRVQGLMVGSEGMEKEMDTLQLPSIRAQVPIIRGHRSWLGLQDPFLHSLLSGGKSRGLSGMQGEA